MPGVVQQLAVRAFLFASRTVGPRRGLRLVVLALGYSAVIAASFVLAYQLRWDFAVPEDFAEQCALLVGPVVLSKLLLLYSFGQFRSVLSYFGLHDLGCVLGGMASAAVIMFGLWLVSTTAAAPPRGVILMDLLLSSMGLAAARVSLRLLRDRTRAWDPRGNRFRRRLGIVGAGDMGAALASDLLTRRNFGLEPVLFLDDDPRKRGRRLHGLPVFGPIARLPEIVEESRITELIITMPSATPKKLKTVLELAQKCGLKTEIVPSFTQLAGGDVQVQRSRPVELEDLLGRQPANLDSARIADLVHDRVVMITGAGGSIGSELCRQVLARGPREVLLVDQSEVQLFQVEQELLAAGHGARVTALVADVLDAARLHEIFDQHRPSLVFHAAAHKHVFMMERQPAEAVKNNFLGTARLAQAAREFGVERFVLISTDKAINPTSVMGASKRLAEYAILANQQRSAGRTAYMAVRFGNVLGSSGSVIPIFKQQIAAGGPVTVTHPEVTRYFMTVAEAVGLVLQAATMGRGGEVFVLDMGTPLKIVDVARQLIELSGFRPDLDIELKFIGLRPGEKLFEELRHHREGLATTDHARVLRLEGDPPTPLQVDECLGELTGSLYTHRADELKLLIRKWVPEYTPHLDGSPAGGTAPFTAVVLAESEGAPSDDAALPERIAGLPAYPAGSEVAQRAKALYRP